MEYLENFEEILKFINDKNNIHFYIFNRNISRYKSKLIIILKVIFL